MCNNAGYSPTTGHFVDSVTVHTLQIRQNQTKPNQTQTTTALHGKISNLSWHNYSISIKKLIPIKAFTLGSHITFSEHLVVNPLIHLWIQMN